MSNKKQKGLGRGLEALLGPIVVSSAGGDSTPAATGHDVVGAEISRLRLGQIVAGKYQPRVHMDEGALQELAQSIQAQGVMQPILVRPMDGTNPVQYEIIAGERRFRAAKLAGLDEVPVLVKPVPDDAAAAMALIENMQREDLNPLEEARGLQRLVKEFGLTHEAAATAVGRSRSAATNLLRLLNLADPVQTMLIAGDIDMGHARSLLALDRATQITAANQMVAKKMSVREAERLVKKMGAQFSLTPARPQAEKPRDIRRVEDELADLLATTVKITIKKQTKHGGQLEQQGEISVGFSSLAGLEEIISKLKVKL